METHNGRAGFCRALFLMELPSKLLKLHLITLSKKSQNHSAFLDHLSALHSAVQNVAVSKNVSETVPRTGPSARGCLPRLGGAERHTSRRDWPAAASLSAERGQVIGSTAGSKVVTNRSEVAANRAASWWHR